MILYNVTASVDKSIEQEWLHWMRTQHIPQVMATACFQNHKVLRIMGEQPDPTIQGYAVQYFAETESHLHAYLNEHAPRLRQEVLDRYGEKCLTFRTVLEEV